MSKYTDINAATIDQWIEDGWEWGKPITHEKYMEAVNGCWDQYLTPTRPVPHEWFGELKGARVLGLASGGGQQMPVFAALGAECTVLDYSLGQLASEKMVAEREGYEIEIIRADMTEELPFADESFDIIFHPVSNCYIEDVFHVWKECYRILKKGGILLAGLDNGIAYAFSDDKSKLIQRLPYNPLKDPKLMEEAVKAGDGVQFSHSIEEQVDGQIRAGFTLTNIYQDTDGYGEFEKYQVPTFWVTRAVKA